MELGHRNNYQIIHKLFGYDIFRNNLQRKKFQANWEVSEVLIIYVTNREKARVILHIEAGHSSNSLIILKLFRCGIYCNNLQHKEFQGNLEVSEVLITYVTNSGKARVMLPIGAGHSNNCQMILKLFRFDIFCYNLQHKNILSKFGFIRGINHLH